MVNIKQVRNKNILTILNINMRLLQFNSSNIIKLLYIHTFGNNYTFFYVVAKIDCVPRSIILPLIIFHIVY